MKLWQVSAAVPGSAHLFKNSLFYGNGGRRLVGYDNEAGKDDYRHYGGREEAYGFTKFRQMRRGETRAHDADAGGNGHQQ